MKEQKCVWFVAQTWIDSNMKARVTVHCLADNGWEGYWGDLNSKHICYFRTKEAAEKWAAIGTSYATVHFTHVDSDVPTVG